jgi:hypothetical protein
MENKCIWTYIEHLSYFNTSCFHTQFMNENNFYDSKFEFCPFCGKKIKIERK